MLQMLGHQSQVQLHAGAFISTDGMFGVGKTLKGEKEQACTSSISTQA